MRQKNRRNFHEPYISHRIHVKKIVQTEDKGGNKFWLSFTLKRAGSMRGKIFRVRPHFDLISNFKIDMIKNIDSYNF